MPSVSHRQIVAVDLDDTLSHTIEALSAWHNDTYETNLKHSDFHTQNLWEVWGGSREEACQKVREFYTSKHFMDLQPINDYALESLRMLKRRRFSLVIVTSRQQLVAEETKRWVDKCYPGVFDSIYFCNLYLTHAEQQDLISKPKSAILREINAELLVEDSLEHALECAQVGVPVLLFDREGSYGWNHINIEGKGPQEADAMILPRNVTRIKTWKQVIAHFPKPASPLRFCWVPSDFVNSDDESDDLDTVNVDDMSDDEQYGSDGGDEWTKSNSRELIWA
ncbi:unnamed protein product [Umbelopsis ramanniana]